CQVPNLVRGAAPEVNLEILQRELGEFVSGFIQGTNYERFDIPPANRTIHDIAISGNGEPTSAPEFDQIVAIIGRCLRGIGLPPETKLVLITNGSLVHRPDVQKGITLLAQFNGEVWFKLDCATNAGMRRINDANITMTTVHKNLATCAGLCPTWVQTCAFALDGDPPSAEEQKHYTGFLSSLVAEGVQLKGVLLYGIARPSHQPEAPRLARLPQAWLEEYAGRISTTGLQVKINV
ncbi:MAG: radical SAM protein, partial [Gammaproteobacteria bacterium]